MFKKYWVLPAALLAIFSCPGITQAQTISSIVNSGSLTAESLAPGSIATIFGTNLASATASAASAATPPVQLAGASVTVGGTAAALFYVSPVQINFVIPATAGTGAQAVVVTSGSGVATSTVTLDVNAAPGLFSLTGTGTNDGAIIQALTGRVGAFSVNSGAGPNYLSLFLTGANLTAPATVDVGGVSVTITFAGASPCCVGLQQINVTLPASLAGAGRVPVVVYAGGQLSNVVEVVILPAQGSGEFAGDADNQDRSRELAGIAWIPGTSLALVADENDDVVREIDVAGKQVTHTISLAADSQPTAIAVNSAGTTAVVAERNRAKVAVIDIASLTVKTEVAVGAGPLSVAIAGNLAVVVNGDNGNVTVVDLTADAATGNVAVGHGARGVAIDAAGHAYVTNQDDGTISVIDPVARTVLTTLSLGVSRPSAIQIVGTTGFAIVADPATSPNGKVLLVNLTSGAVTPFSVNVARTGGASAVVVQGTTAYIANQAGGSISILPLTFAGGVVTGTPTTLSVDKGVRSLAIDGTDNDLLAVSESTGSIDVVSLASGQVVARINGVLAEAGEGDTNTDDHSDHDNAANHPAVTSIAPVSGKAGTTFTLTITGQNFKGATAVIFVNPALLPGNSHGKGSGGSNGGGVGATADTAFTVTAIQVNAAGTQVTATVAIAAKASTGVRLVRVSTPNGDSPGGASSTFTVTQ